jgi:hypothetical protein
VIHILASTRPHYEFAIADAINDQGGIAIVPRRLDIVDKRPVYRPFLPNYMFLALTEQQWHLFHGGPLYWMKPRRNAEPQRAVLPPFRKVLDILPATWGQFQGFAERAETACDRRMEQWETGIKVARYRKGDKLQILGGLLFGQLHGQIGEFLHLDGHGNIVARLEFMGKPITATLDPKDVRGMAAE